MRFQYFEIRPCVDCGAYTRSFLGKPVYHDSIGDYVFTPGEAEAEARQESKRLLENPQLHCWAIAPIARASEPHWTEGEA